ncbi:MAG TPA: dockerin type I repeat-containing protein [Candidatus Ratteibacteria bacterium]|uniref:Dockerin domain-containing protein n=1 Tax=candidate division TA06 bacterium ADurb.Bin131 TaxID=1852827 RepID=A0A1V6C535_UNCT6|nr:MAG: hypothetical protein BWX89_01546 [candidate division TA06 bacterium ADurb.Bin131]HOC02307.1 dockerin type I repeat-containing protein [bacterium]HON04821.1 dockerin type I repeat-containing protein [bacterium]HRS07141.1 dockerin type I repeat-containing protein [Candidatus Ratteibacteria bacterium]HRV03499.1 dockerin type I repeat-containing protein [Candidatus Ratteibacteria bacterium]
MRNNFFLLLSFCFITCRVSLSAIPIDPKITNVTNNSVTISWITLSDCSGYIRFGLDPDNITSVAYDSRGQQYSGITHYVVVGEPFQIQSETRYYFDIIIDDDVYNNEGNHCTFVTGKNISVPPPLPDTKYGRVFKNDNHPASGSIVYLSVENTNGEQSQSLSCLVENSGYWLIDIGSIRATDLSDYFKYNENSTVKIECYNGKYGWAKFSADINSFFPANDIVLNLYEKGDVNLDLSVDISDVILVLRMAIDLDKAEKDMGDLNDDGVIDILDVVLLLKKAVGLE